MPATILVATPHTAFGELLRISLEDSGQYQVRLVQSAKEARTSVGHTSFHLAILDSALGDEPFIPLCMYLLEQQPGIRLVVIPPDNNPNHPALGGLIPHGYLSRPFYLPDLIETISRLLVDRDRQVQAQMPAGSFQPTDSFPPTDNFQSTGISMSPGNSLPASDAPAVAFSSTMLPPWLQEPLTLQRYLESAIADTQAIAAIASQQGPLPGDHSDTKGIVRASTGALNDKAAQELTGIVFRYWNQAENTDLMRFVRLIADKRDYLVYATQIKAKMVLILVYDTSAPLSQIRPQSKAMAQSLAILTPDQYSTGQKSAPEMSAANDRPSMPAAKEPETQPLDENPGSERSRSGAIPPGRLPYEEISAPPSDDSWVSTSTSPDDGSEHNTVPPYATSLPTQPAAEDEDDQIGAGFINLSALLGSVPSPDPEGDGKPGSGYGSGWFLERSANSPIPTMTGGVKDWSSSEETFLPAEQPDDHPTGSTPTEDNPANMVGMESSAELTPKKRSARTAPLDPQTLPRDSLPASPSRPVDYALSTGSERAVPQAPDSSPGEGKRQASLEVKTEPPVLPHGVPPPAEQRNADNPVDLVVGPEPSSNALEDTHPTVVSTVTNLNQLEPASPALSLLNYTCVLVPRLPQHYLTGDLADRLAIWVQQLCLAFGWRLEGISIRPEYLQWTVQVAPAISPGNLVRIVRQRTSQQIFGNYAHLAELNPSGDFWAAGYLIVSGAQPPSAQLLRDYILQTRKRQGINTGK